MDEMRGVVILKIIPRDDLGLLNPAIFARALSVKSQEEELKTRAYISAGISIDSKSSIHAGLK
jgi:hypothetical protein